MNIGSSAPLSLKLKLLRMSHNKTQAELANELCISRGCLANYETGKRQPDQETILSICNYFNVQPNHLLMDYPGESLGFNEGQGKKYINIFKGAKSSGDSISLKGMSLASKIALYSYAEYLKQLENPPKKPCKD